MIMIPKYHYNKEEPKTGLKQVFYAIFLSIHKLCILTKIEKTGTLHNTVPTARHIPIFRARNFLLNFLHIYIPHFLVELFTYLHTSFSC